MEFYATSPKTEVNIAKQRETEEMFQKQKQEFEKLRSDVQIKLKFLDENRVSSFQNAEIRRMMNQVLLFLVGCNIFDKQTKGLMCTKFSIDLAINSDLIRSKYFDNYLTSSNRIATVVKAEIAILITKP